MQRYSFYYRDSLDLRSLLPQAYKFSLLFPDKDDNVVIEDGVMRLKRPEEFDPSRIHNIVRVYIHKYDYFKIEINIRCWRNDEYTLKEITPYIQSSYVCRLLRRVINMIHPLPINTHLLTENGVSYFSHNNKLIKRQNGVSMVIGSMPRLSDPIYYELLLCGDEAALRTGYRIYMSSNGMQQWKLIYEGKRAIKNSMVWIEEEKSLLFSEYTPGLNLSRHHLYKYFVETGETKTIMTFYTPDEHAETGVTPYCRHIHVLMKDPYTNDIYMGTGDSDDESAIYRSSDNGNTFQLIGFGKQTWRTLSFIFTEDSVSWNTDTPDPQYLCRLSRAIMKNPITDESVERYPLFNSASWNSFYDKDEDMYLMSASCEGSLYDKSYRAYGIVINDGAPTVYKLFEDNRKDETRISRSHQLFVLGKDSDGKYWFYDTCKKYYRAFVLTKN